MTDETTLIGRIHVAPRAVATIAYQSAMRSYGVVGMASQSLVNGLARLLVKDPTRGVQVRVVDEDIDIDLYIVIEYGTRIKSVARSVANTVRFQVEKALGIRVHEVNVHVQGLRISDLD